MKFEPKKPIAFFDTETTGKEAASARIVEISIMIVYPDGRVFKYHTLINPCVPIPAEATAVHNITDEMVKDQPTWEEVAPHIFKLLDGCDLGGYNIIRYDVPLISEEFSRVNIVFPAPGVKMFDSCSIFFKKEERNLAAASRFYLGRELSGAHGAAADTMASLQVFFTQLDRYEDLREMDYEQVAEFCKPDKRMDLAGKIARNEKNRAVFTFGKHKDKPVLDVFKSDPGYYKWFMKNDFTANSKQVLNTIWEWFQNPK